MAFQPVPNTASFRFVYSRGQDFSAVNTFYFRDTTNDWDVGHLENMATELLDWWNTNTKPLMSSALTLDTIVFRDEASEFGDSGELSVGTAGTRGADLVASIVATRVMWVGDAGGAPRRGATYHIGGIETDCGSGTWSSTFVASVEDAYDALRAVDSGTGEALVLVSRFSGMALVEQPNGEILRKPVIRSTAVTNTIQDVKVRSRISSQQRRRAKTPIYVS